MVKKALSIILPAYNEEKRIGSVLVNYAEHYQKRFKLELIVACNGCTDGTVLLVNRLSKQYPAIRCIDFKEKLGKGGAIIEGFKIAQGEYIGFSDADESVSPKEFDKLVKALNNADVAIASRKLKDSNIIVKQPLLRRIASHGLFRVLNLLFDLNIKDTQCGAKLFKKKVIREILPEISSRGFEIDIELLLKAKKNGREIKEIPIEWSDSQNSSLQLRKDMIAIGKGVYRLYQEQK